jgi:hypothetical protein
MPLGMRVSYTTSRRHSELLGRNVSSWPEASVRCVAAIRPESGVKPTCRHRSNDAIDPGCVKTLGGITAPGILGPTVMRRAKKRKNLSSARHYDQIRFRFHTTKTLNVILLRDCGATQHMVAGRPFCKPWRRFVTMSPRAWPTCSGGSTDNRLCFARCSGPRKTPHPSRSYSTL